MLTIEVKADILGLRVINVGAAFDEDCLTRMHDEISRAIIEDQHTIIYDFSEVKEITSGEGAIFLGLLATVRDHGIFQAIANLQIPVRRIFNLIGITQVVKTYDSVESAIGVLAA
ncbi:MAG: STAS domain-containing protein [Planctomycetota bacterium]|nr:MAG: STAS domain-containing protein [Planctomycetota bacterium]